ncbi:MAG: 3'-5' exonuclease [Gammaproteobacteria bacterium]|nr:3'-5' exonuclease [Gammaproteobacteria bacterium]
MPDCPLRDYYEVPFPMLDTDWRQVDYLALDFETTGLDEEKDEILSLGYTTIRGHTLNLGDATHILAKPSGALPEASVIVHGIMDDQAASAQSLEEALPDLLYSLAGKAMLAHHAAIEYHFLSNACKRVYGYPFVGPVVDTLALEVRVFRNSNRSIRSGDLRLAAARDRYNLPRYPAHNALTDALAAGELFLAQVAHRRSKRSPTLRDVTVVS